MPTESTPPDSLSQLKQTDVFIGGQDGTHTYRIPSVVVAPNGELLAFCEARRTTGSDTDDIDLVLKRSVDGGATWSEMQVIWDDGPNTCGNPCAVVDQETGTVWLLACHNLVEDHEMRIWEGVSKSTRTIWAISSNDSGASWSAPVEITSGTKAPNWSWYATGPGSGIQLQYGDCKGRLVIPCDHGVAGGWDYIIPTSSTATTAARRGNSGAAYATTPRVNVRWSSWLTAGYYSVSGTTIGQIKPTARTIEPSRSAATAGRIGTMRVKIEGLSTRSAKRVEM